METKELMMLIEIMTTLQIKEEKINVIIVRLIKTVEGNK